MNRSSHYLEEYKINPSRLTELTFGQKIIDEAKTFIGILEDTLYKFY
jgi:hypothetical protein